MRVFTLLAAAASASQNVLWLPLGDSITFGCTGPTIKDCHHDGGGYRVPLAFALSQPALGDPSNAGFNITTMGTDQTGPAYVPSSWLRHCGFPGWTIPMMDNFLPKAFASNPSRPDLITIHLGTVRFCARQRHRPRRPASSNIQQTPPPTPARRMTAMRATPLPP
jgi:hypothetical protein